MKLPITFLVTAALGIGGYKCVKDHDDAPAEAPPPPSAAATFTLGSTEAEVQAVMGTPSQLDDTFGQWSYDYSEVDFEGGKVVGWWDRSHRLKLRMDPHDAKVAAAAKARGTFHKGSTRDEVIGAQGVPSQIDHTFDQWSYDYSEIDFSGDVVSGWWDRSKNLRVR